MTKCHKELTLRQSMEAQSSCTNLNVKNCTEITQHWRVHVIRLTSNIQGKASFRGGLPSLTPLSLAASSAQQTMLCNDASKLVMPSKYSRLPARKLHILKSIVCNYVTIPARYAVRLTATPQATNARFCRHHVTLIGFGQLQLLPNRWCLKR